MMRTITLLTLVLVMLSCQTRDKQAGSNVKTEEINMNIKKESFGTTKDGKEVFLYTLKNTNNIEVGIINYGGVIVSVNVPDKNGNMGDVVLGFDNLSDYEEKSPFFGCITGRFANRIKDAKFTLEGQEYTLAANNGPNHLHGGPKGFNAQVWEPKEIESEDGIGVELTYVSPDGDQGYPGTLTTKVTYTLTDKNELKIDYEATTDKTTILNLTNHSYFNLKDGGNSDILSHSLRIYADSYTPTDETQIPTGEIETVEGTPMDFFTGFYEIGERIDADFEPLKIGGGYDHNYVLDAEDKGELKLAAEVVEPVTGRTMKVYTKEPGVQLYTGNFLQGPLQAKGVAVGKRHGLCLETQHFPDGPNKPEFPSTVLKPGEKYISTTIYEFGVQE